MSVEKQGRRTNDTSASICFSCELKPHTTVLFLHSAYEKAFQATCIQRELSDTPTRHGICKIHDTKSTTAWHGYLWLNQRR
jgi:hypothetical protein